MNLSILDSIQINPKARKSVEYAKARTAIDDNSTCRKERRQLKVLVAEHLGGKIAEGEVVFPDDSKARF